MNTTLSNIGLELQLAARRLGWANGLAMAFLALVCGVFFGLLPELRAREARSKAALERAHKSASSQAQPPSAPAPTETERRMQAFRDMLGESRFAEQQVKAIFSIAAKNNLNLSQGEYKLAHERSGGFDTYAILLPVRGQYGAIRAFCQQVLLTIPFASLDQVDFKRDSVGNANLEAKLRFTLYLDRADGTGTPDRQEGAME